MMTKYLTALKNWGAKWAGPVFLVVILSIILFWIIATFFDKRHSSSFLIAGIAISIACAIGLFTAELIINDEEPRRERHIARGVLAVGYMFLITTTCIAFSLMYIDINNLQTKPANYRLVNKPNYLPMLVYGCEYQAPVETKENDAASNDNATGLTTIIPVTIPENLKYCGTTTPQRMVILGGVVTLCGLTNNCSAIDAPSPNPMTHSENGFYHEQKNCSTDIDKLLITAEYTNPCASADLLKRVEIRLQNAKAVESENNTISDFGLKLPPNKGADVSKIAELRDLVRLVEARIEKKKVLDKHYQIDNHVSGSLIVGGIVVPAYFIFCALLGAMIAMARKLPEFQARLKRTEQDTNEKMFRGEPYAPIGYSELPELVLFQIIQVASAPILAIIAYGYLNDDFESQFTGISIAFAAGFSSEWVLVMIRSITDRLGGAKPKTVALRSVSTEPESQNFINLKSGRAYKYDTVVLTQAVERLAAGKEVVITHINGNQVVARESGGESRFTRSADFFDVKKERPDYISMSDIDSKPDG